VTQLSTQLYQYERARDSLASRSTSHPDLPRLNQLIGSTEADLLHAVQGGIQSAVASLEGRITAMNDLRARQQHLSTTEEEEARLTERVDNVQKVADELRVEFQRAKIAEAVTVGQVEIVDHAALPAKPAGLGLPEQIALGRLQGLMMGAAGACLRQPGAGVRIREAAHVAGRCRPAAGRAPPRAESASAAGIDGLPRRGSCPRARLADYLPSVARLPGQRHSPT